MSNKQPNIVSILVAVAIPNDLKQERQIVKNAVTQVNRILKSKGKQYQLQITEKNRKVSETSTHGMSSDYYEQIKNAGIFIGILRDKFDDHNSRSISDDGLVFLPAGKLEFDTAISARENTTGVRPAVQFYQKIRKSKKLFRVTNEEEIIQYGQVLHFLREIKSNANRQEVFQQFVGKDLQNLLQKGLIELCSKNEENWLCNNRVSMPVGSINRARIDPQQTWISKSPLKFNPFDDRLIERIPIDKYAVAGCSVTDAKRLIWDKNIIYVFGEDGTGKTTLLKNTVRSIEKRKHEDALWDDTVYCLEINSTHLARQLENVGGVTAYRNYHFSERIYELVCANLAKRSKRFVMPKVDFSQPASTLITTMKLLNKNGYSSLLCMVDGFDDIYQEGSADAPELRAIHLLRNMILTNIDNFRLRFFLNSKLKELISSENQYFRLNRSHTIDLTWDSDSLIQMVNQRLRVASRTEPGVKLSELCYQTPGIEVEMAECSGGNPRAMLWLARRLFEVHLQQSPLTDNIRAESWLTVQREWDKVKKRYLPKKSFSIRNKLPYFGAKVIVISPILSALLCYLINAKGAICTLEELIPAGYPNEDPKFLVKTFYQQMGNLKKKLDEIAPGWLQNVHSKGYRLRDPDTEFGDGQ